MAINLAYQTYQQNQVTTATPGELTLMLYNGIIKFIKQAQTAIDQRDYERANLFNLKAQNIITELTVTLKMEYAIAQHLSALYEYMGRRLIEANIKKDKAILDEVLGMATELRDSWSEAVKIARQERHLKNDAR
jgi:flagellar protein FliS